GRVVTTVVTGLCAFYAFSTLPLAQVYPLLFAMPLLVTVFSIPILGEKVGIHRWAAVILGLIGVVIVVRPGQAELAPGHFAAMTAAVTGALASVIVRKIGSEERSVVLLLSPLLGNVIVMAILLPFVWQPLQIGDLGLLAVIAIFGLTASFLQILAYRAGEAAIVAPMQYSQILWAVFYGWIIFHESVDIPTLVGAGVVILSGIYIVIRETRVSENQPVLRTRGRSETRTCFGSRGSEVRILSLRPFSRFPLISWLLAMSLAFRAVLWHNFPEARKAGRMQVEPTPLSGVLVITPKRFGDHRGFFSESYSAKRFAEAGIEIDFVQDNHSVSEAV
ncbi:dTDP-4-dehydrorhamnose 3,5-epimerase-related like protein, partial [Aduncisulcus paluster]